MYQYCLQETVVSILNVVFPLFCILQPIVFNFSKLAVPENSEQLQPSFFRYSCGNTGKTRLCACPVSLLLWTPRSFTVHLQEDPESSHRTMFGVDFVSVSAEQSLLFISLELQPFLCNWICFYGNLRCRVRFISPKSLGCLKILGQ